MLLLKNTPIDTILSMTEIIDAVEDSLKEMALGRGFDLPRRRVHHPTRMIFGRLPGSFRGAMGAYLQTDLDRRLHHETVILYSVESGEPLILFQDCRINQLRTGPRAETQLQAVCAVRPIARAKVFSPTPEHRTAFAEKMSRELKIDIRPTKS